MNKIYLKKGSKKYDKFRGNKRFSQKKQRGGNDACLNDACLVPNVKGILNHTKFNTDVIGGIKNTPLRIYIKSMIAFFKLMPFKKQFIELTMKIDNGEENAKFFIDKLKEKKMEDNDIEKFITEHILNMDLNSPEVQEKIKNTLKSAKKNMNSNVKNDSNISPDVVE